MRWWFEQITSHFAISRSTAARDRPQPREISNIFLPRQWSKSSACGCSLNPQRLPLGLMASQPRSNLIGPMKAR